MPFRVEESSPLTVIGDDGPFGFDNVFFRAPLHRQDRPADTFFECQHVQRRTTACTGCGGFHTVPFLDKEEFKRRRDRIGRRRRRYHAHRMKERMRNDGRVVFRLHDSAQSRESREAAHDRARVYWARHGVEVEPDFGSTDSDEERVEPKEPTEPKNAKAIAR